MASLDTKADWVRFLDNLLAALEDGQIAVESLKGKTLPEMADIAEQGWDNFDAAIAAAEQEKGPQ